MRRLHAFSQFALGLPAALGGSPASCSGGQLSCHNTTAVANLCCFNAPGGQLLQTQFWDYNPATGPDDSWTVHGLWPDRCDGSYEQYCDSSREYTNITSIIKAAGQTVLLDYMNQYWKDQGGNDESFWEHEWGKHGTCVSTLDTGCYSSYAPQEEVVDFFQKTVDLFKGLPTYKTLSDAGITPSTSKTYTSAAIQAAIKKVHGHDVTLGCSSGALNEVWYHYNVKGSVQTGDFEPTDPDGSKSTCPDSGVKYLPKSSGGGGGTSTSSGIGPTTPPGTPFSGSGYLSLSKGCLISTGKWFTSGTCATFRTTQTGDGFTLTSSKGPCGVVSGAFTCGSGVATSTFTNSNGHLAYDGEATFFADAQAQGQTQETIFTVQHDVSVQVGWQSV